MDEPAITRGQDLRAFWTRLDIRNDSAQPCERWLETADTLGHALGEQPMLGLLRLQAQGPVADGGDLT